MRDDQKTGSLDPPDSASRTRLRTVKAIFSEGSLKLSALESIFSEWIHWKCRSNILFSVKVHWNCEHWDLFSVNSFAENKVKIVKCYTSYTPKCGAHLPSLGHSAWRWIYYRSCDARLVQRQTYGYLPSTHHCHWPLISTYFRLH